MSLAHIEIDTSNRSRLCCRIKTAPQKWPLRKKVHGVYGEAVQEQSTYCRVQNAHTGGVHLIADYQSPRQKPSQSQRAVTSFGYRRRLASARDWQTQQVRCRFISGCGVEASPKKLRKKINRGSINERSAAEPSIFTTCMRYTLASGF